MMSRLLALTAGIGAFALGGQALAQTCVTDADCAEGQVCLATPCAAPDCDPDDAECDPPVCEDVCVDDPGGVPWSECASDDDCGAGFVCEAVGGSDCACPAGADCMDCEPETFYGCVPAPCQSDADCGEGLVCLTFESASCSDTAEPMPVCEPGQECEEPSGVPAPPECETETVSFCGPKYLAACEVDGDCGEGFTCEVAEECSCSGGGATPTDPVPEPGQDGGDAGDPMPPREFDDGAPPEECVCEPTGEKYCQAQEIACEDDAACPTGWTCESYPSTPSTCWTDESGNVECDDEQGVPAPSVCVPPYYGEYPGPGQPGGVPVDDKETSEPNRPDPTTDPTDPTTETPGESQGPGAQPTEATGGASGCAGGEGGLGATLTLLAALLLGGLVRRERSFGRRS